MDAQLPWPAFLSRQTQIRDRLLEAYDGRGRGYHDLRHLNEVLDRVGLLLDEADGNVDRDAVVLAAWFHDAVYDCAADDEERSAVLAERELATVGVPLRIVDEVARLVRVTADHRPEPDDLAGQVLSDADLAILAADPVRYAEYVAGVREEFSDVADDDFRRGRAGVLRDLLAKPTLFHTRYARESWESAARENVARELEDLEGP
jgi:predicted metal-dependent HD superfamily phosphohydrolase